MISYFNFFDFLHLNYQYFKKIYLKLFYFALIKAILNRFHHQFFLVKYHYQLSKYLKLLPSLIHLYTNFKVLLSFKKKLIIIFFKIIKNNKFCFIL